ncbi:MAG: sensor histidine kinase, partial [Longimicrobiales bacterium]
RDGSGTVPPGIAGLSATACVFLTFTGALRLTRTAAVLSTVVALTAWVAVAVAGAIEWQAIVLIAAALVATGFLGSYVTRTIRRVITNEVGRTRVRRMYDEATEAIRAREEVLRIVSHDLRNPLNAVGMTAEMLMEEMELPVERRMDYLQRIRRSSERMNRLIQDLLDVARMEAGTLSVRPEPVRCGELLGDVTEMMAPLAADRQLDFRVLPGDTLPDVSVDRERIVQVFSNLLGNAFKFTAPGGRVYIRGERMGDKVRFSVTDTGPGIAPEHLQEVFGRLWQANRADGRGLGLGLAIAKSIVEAHGERIGVDSRIGEGTTFWFTAPVVRE